MILHTGDVMQCFIKPTHCEERNKERGFYEEPPWWQYR